MDAITINKRELIDRFTFATQAIQTSCVFDHHYAMKKGSVDEYGILSKSYIM